ncbi:hypothetical protein FDH34_gp291 [Serratia phage BF]|uniref:Uncharacterized protein n=2 Tax=Eneladusvirus BF TaxID=2560751 RepID=A0A7L8ZNK3_9CAUD|nr:hypothetical protein FDH34_gp291 [Serratia phage BF]AQW88816.1 hypothetical protein BF_0291 [Serratia phage BF]QOI71772.1 hypothetical protein pEaSNUABM47_00288 [Erwinia phage pEa_SNUABM_47]
MKNKKINENASSGATSAGGIASVSGGLNYPLISRLPPTNFFGYKEYKPKKKKKD